MSVEFSKVKVISDPGKSSFKGQIEVKANLQSVEEIKGIFILIDPFFHFLKRFDCEVVAGEIKGSREKFVLLRCEGFEHLYLVIR